MKSDQPVKKRYFTIALLPNLITLFNLFSGFVAILMIHREMYRTAAGLIVLGLVWDSLDGKISRIFKNSTDFGRELDSLADIVSFVVAPAMFVAKMFFLKISPWMLLIVFIYLGCGAYRLARFNVNAPIRKYFQGLPTPAAGLALTMFALMCHKDGWTDFALCTAFLIGLMLSLSFLMVSSVRYPKLSDVKFSDWKIFFYTSLAIFSLSYFFFNQITAMTLVFLLYVLISPIHHFLLYRALPHPHEETLT